MTPAEKWERLQSPKDWRDYHLSLTEDELRQFRLGRAFLAEIRRIERARANEKRSGAKWDGVACAMGASAGEKMARMIADIYSGRVLLDLH